MRTEEDAQGFRVAPEGAGSHPGVVMIHDVWGLTDHTRDLARRLAEDGFTVLALDLYRKTGQPTISDPEGAMAWIRELDDRVVLETLAQAIDDLTEHPWVEGRRVGVTGFCMGGQYALLGACVCRGLSVCVPCYGMLRYEPGLDPERKPRSPLDALPDLSCPVLGLYGAEDHLIPVADVRALEEGLVRSGQDHHVELYPGAGHAFFNDTRPAMYREEVAKKAWLRLVAFLRERLEP